MKVFSKEEASKYVNGLIPSIKNIDDLVAVIQDSKYSNIKESKVLLEEDLNELLRSLKLTLGALYTEDFAKLYLKLDEIPSELRVYFVENSEKKMFLGQDLYEYRLSHSLAEDISIDKVKELISEKLKGFDLDEQKIQKLIDKSLATLSLDTKSIEYLIESNVSKITNDKILKAVNDKLTEMDLQDTDKVEEARVKSIVETRLNEVIITPTDVRDEVRKEFTSKGISEELLNTVKNFDNNIQEALSKITISDEQIRNACQGLNLTENQTTEVKALLNDYVKLEALTTKLEELKTTISAETDTKISDKAETLVKSEFLTTELAKYVLSTTLEEKLAAIQSGISAEEVDSKITAKLENYVKSEFLNTELEKYISKEALETKLNDIKANLLSEEALSAYVKSEFLSTELEKYAKKSEVYTKEEVDQKVAQGGTFDASSYYQKSEVYSKEESLSKDEINTKLSTKADIVNVYNKSEVDEKIQNIHAGTDENKVNELIDTKIEPLAKKSETYTKEEVDQKVTASGTFDGSQYYNKSEVDSKVNDLTSKITENSEIKEFVKAEIKKVVSNAPESLDTIAEIATALKNNPDVIAEILNKIEAKIDITAADAKYALKTEVQATDLSNYYNKTEVYNKSEVDTKIPDVSTFAKKSEIPSLENYYNKTETYNKSEVDAKVAAGGTFDASSYYLKSDIDSKVQELAKKSETYNKTETYNKSEIDAKIPNVEDFAKKSETYNKSEVDTKISGIQSGTNEEKVNELIDAKLNPVKTSLFTETAADAKYELKTDAFTKAKADELYLSKTDKVKLKGQTATSIADTDEIPFRTDENSDLQFIPVSALKVKGSTSSSATKDEISEQLTSRMGSFTLGDGYLIAKALRPYLNNFTVPERIVEKTVRNLTIRFDMVKGSTTSYGAVIDEIRFYRDGEYYYPKYSTKMKKQDDTEVMILSLTKPSNFNEAFMNTNIPDVPEDYQMEDTELKLTITCSGAYYYETYYTPRHAFSPNVFEYQYYMDHQSRNTSWINVEVFSKDGKYFDMISFKNGIPKILRYSDSVTITINNDNEQLLRKTFNTDLNTVDTKENKIITVFKDLVKTLPETEENTVIENLKQYNKQYIDEKVKANELVNKTDLHNELTNNIKTEIDTVLNQSELMTNLDMYISTQLWKKGIPMPTIPTKKPKTLTVIFDNITSSSTSYGGGLKNIVFEDADGSRYYVQKCSAQNVNKMDFILSKTPNTTPYSTMQSAGIPNNYELQEGEIKGTVEAYASYDYLVQNLMGTVVLSKLDPFAKYTYTFTDFYPKTIKMENSNSSYWNPNLRVTVLGDNNVILCDEFKNLVQSSRFESVLPDIGSKDLSKIQTILNGEEVKEYINNKVTTDVTTKFNSVNFLSTENLEEKITEKMPEVVKSFADNGGFVKFMKQAFDILGEEWPQEISSKPTDFKFKINNLTLGVGGYAVMGYVKLTDNNDKPLFLKAVSKSKVINKDIDIILTTNEADAANNTTVPTIDTTSYVLQEGEYKATVKGTNQYNNGNYYWSYYIFNPKGTNYYNYFLSNDVNTELTVTVHNFYPKAMTITNGTDSRNSKSFVVKLYSDDTCYLNKKVKDLNGVAETSINIPKF
nr:MAG TPA: MAEBL protein [Caudoviricetes sp.]